jgi:hypothetical protein
MATPENTFIQAVHRHLPPEDDFHREKMSNPYTSGTADVWYSGTKDLWVEYKFVVVPKRDDTMIDLCRGKKPAFSVLQRNWMRRRFNEKRSVWLIIGSAAGGVILYHPDVWEKPISAKDFRACLRTRPQLAQTILNFAG